MPLVPLAQLLAHEVRNTRFSSKKNDEYQEAFAKLLFGVTLRYSCPLPLLIDDNSSRWSSFQRETYERLRLFYLGTCEAVVEQCPTFLQWSPAEQFEVVFILNEALPKLIVYPSYASGDMYGVGASMLLDTQLELRIVSDSNKGRVDRTGALTAFLGAFLPNIDRISTVKTSGKVDSRAFLPPFDSTKSAEQEYITWLSGDLWAFMEKRKQIFLAVDLFFGTNYVALRFGNTSERQQVRRIVRAGWDVVSANWRGDQVKKIGQFLKGKGFKEGMEDKFPRNKHIVVLWVRFTGKTGGAHVEYDTSFEGLRQLLKVAHDQGNDWAILVGDKPKQSTAFSLEKSQRRGQKITDIIAGSPIKTIDLTEFWGEDGWKRQFPKRTDQFKLFEVLHYHNHVKHLGARSGNLESLALLGYQVRYFEDRYGEHEEALDKKRMEPWHGPVGYQRIQIGQVPTRSGKYIIEQQDHYPKWTYPSRFDKSQFVPTKQKKAPGKKDLEKEKPVAINGFDRGFSILDLAELGRYLKPDPNFKKFHPL